MLKQYLLPATSLTFDLTLLPRSRAVSAELLEILSAGGDGLELWRGGFLCFLPEGGREGGRGRERE